MKGWVDFGATEWFLTRVQQFLALKKIAEMFKTHFSLWSEVKTSILEPSRKTWSSKELISAQKQAVIKITEKKDGSKGLIIHRH